MQFVIKSKLLWRKYRILLFNGLSRIKLIKLDIALVLTLSNATKYGVFHNLVIFLFVTLFLKQSLPKTFGNLHGNFDFRHNSDKTIFAHITPLNDFHWYMGQSKLQQFNSLVKEAIFINWREVFCLLVNGVVFEQYIQFCIFELLIRFFVHIAPHLRGAMTSIDIWGDHYCNVHVCACFVSCVFFWPLVSIFSCYIIFYKEDT